MYLVCRSGCPGLMVAVSSEHRSGSFVLLFLDFCAQQKEGCLCLALMNIFSKVNDVVLRFFWLFPVIICTQMQ